MCVCPLELLQNIKLATLDSSHVQAPCLAPLECYLVELSQSPWGEQYLPIMASLCELLGSLSWKIPSRSAVMTCIFFLI